MTTLTQDPTSETAKEAAADARALVLSRCEQSVTGIANLQAHELTRMVARAGVKDLDHAEYLAELLSALTLIATVLGCKASAADKDVFDRQTKDDRWAYLRRFMAELEERGITH